MLGVGACAEYGGGGELYVILEVLSDSADGDQTLLDEVKDDLLCNAAASST